MHNRSKHNCIILKDGVNDPELAFPGKVGLGPFWTLVQVLSYVHIPQLFVVGHIHLDKKLVKQFKCIQK
jgi:hypothetical protein